MNEKTKQRLESEINVPAPTQPVDKLRINESPAAASRAFRMATGVVSIDYTGKGDGVTSWGALSCFADDE